jgi:hypothetical protein
MDKESFDQVKDLVQAVLGYKRNGQPRSLFDIVAKVVKIKDKKKRKLDKDLYDSLKPSKKKDKKKDKKKKKNKKK